MQNERASSGRFTGRHMLAVMVGAFSIIIGVNIFMAVVANTSWTGLVVKNSHVAGLEFNQKSEEARAQDALGWSPHLSIADGVLRYSLTDKDNQPVVLRGGKATFWRPTSDKEDVTYDLAVAGSKVSAPVELGDGVWIISLVIDAGLENPYRDTRRIHLNGGVLR